MREFLDDMHQYMTDGIGRVQAHARTELRKRFYKEAHLHAKGDCFQVCLDGRVIKTPGGKPVEVENEAIARLICSEWDAQGEHIDPRAMPVTRLINSAIEGGRASVSGLRNEVVKFAGNDLLLFRADSPRELVALQREVWDRVLDRIRERFDICFHPVTGILHKGQPERSLKRIRSLLPEGDPVALTALVSITGLMGSGLLAIAVYRDLLDRDAAWQAAHLDEDYNARTWGEDKEALALRKKRRTEFDAALDVLALLESTKPKA